MNEVTIGDKIYISAKRAAEITGYARDYVGQLCREGHVDAKMVGRSWYVYEPSIRAHRFGASEEAVEEEIVEDSAPKVEESPVSSWEKPTYSSEEPKMMPEVGSREYQELLPPAEETLTDMQEAWREWFERKQQAQSQPEPVQINASVPEIEEEATEIAEEVVQEEPEEVEVPLHHLEEDVEEAPEEVEVVEEIVPIRPVYTAPQPARREVEHYDSTPARIVEERVITRPRNNSKKGKTRSNAPVVAVLLGISFVTAAVAVVGSGLADKYIETFAAENPIVNFLVGTREFKRW